MIVNGFVVIDLTRLCGSIMCPGFPIDPVCIETEDGRREYQRLQQQLYEQGLPIRRRLLSIFDKFFALLEREEGV